MSSDVQRPGATSGPPRRRPPAAHPASEVGDSPAELDGHEAIGLEPYFRDTLKIVSDDSERHAVRADVRVLTNNFPSMG